MSPSVHSIAYVSVVHPLHDHRFLYKQCSGLARHGFAVDYYVRHDQSTVLQGVQIRPLQPATNRFSRFLGTFSLLPRLVRGPYAAYHMVDPELLPLGLLLKVFTRRRVVFDAHEDYVDFMRHKHYLPGPLGRIFSLGLRWVLDLSSRVLDGFVFADEGTAGLFGEMAPERKPMFYNFPLRSMFPEQPAAWTGRRYDTVFLGTMSETSGTWVILEAIQKLKMRHPSIRCLFIGMPEAEMKERVLAFVRDKGLSENVEFTGRLPHADVPQLLQQCKVGLIGLLDLPKFHRNIATKLFEYMASGIPVVSSDLPPERRFITAGECGEFFTPGDSAGMAAAIDTILSEPGRGQSMSTRARARMVRENYFAEGEIERLAQFYGWLLSESRRGGTGLRHGIGLRRATSQSSGTR
jgi:glycosyltransferase involved in cell wall biosynthesis